MKITSGRKSLARCLTIFLLSLAGNGLSSHALLNRQVTGLLAVSRLFVRRPQNDLLPSAGLDCISGRERSGRPVVMIHGNAGDVHDFELWYWISWRTNHRLL